MVQLELKVQGFIVNTFKKDWPPAFTEMNEYIRQVRKRYFGFLKNLNLTFKLIFIIQGKLKVQETNYDGFDKMREAFYGLFKGENTGKAVVKA